MMRGGAVGMAAEEATLAEFPQGEGDQDPDNRGGGDDEPWVLMGQHPAKDQSEANQTDTAEGSARGVDAGSHPTAIRAVAARFLFAFFLMTLDQGDAGRENGRESEEEAADRWSESFGDEASEDGGRASEEKPDEVLVRFRFFQG